ncbi:GAF sensor hybrid histidine kinase [Stanieria sp. NIES-3757]|nr:GAF sensor hybrid histidine kinase [Stanieria sp. NIES-3757]
MSIFHPFIIKRKISSASFEQLYSLWKKTAKQTGEETIFFTEEMFLSLITPEKTNLEIDGKLEKFCLLITPQLNALLLGRFDRISESYQISITFDHNAIADYFNRLTEQYQVNLNSFKTLQERVILRLNNFWNPMNEFTCQVINILTSNPNYENYPTFFNNLPVEEIIHYQVEQERILNQVKIQISQHTDLPEIIQTAIEQVCDLLSLDRLVVYQLDMSIDSIEFSHHNTKLIDTVTYEAKSSDDISSILYFQDEVCFQDVTESKHKYRNGFSLVVNDTKTGITINPCLQELMKKLNIRAKLVTPINVHDKLWGFLIAHQCLTPRQWQSREIRFLKQIAEYLAIAIYQNQSYQQLQAQKQLLEEQVNTKAKQLQDALLAAQVASQSKHEFIGSISHELRTPLTCIIGLSGTLLHWSLANGKIPLPVEKQQQYLKTIQDSGKQLLSLINNILEVSELEAGKYLLNISRFSLQELAQNALQFVQEDAQNKQISLNLEFQVKPEENLFDADRDRLNEILLNLLSNGIKFTPAGGKVTLRIWKEKQQAIFEVEDNGIGISQQQLPLLFEKFKQLESFLQRTHGGVGLGLALTKQLVELHGGNISVESVLGEGSVFTVYLPNQTLEKSPVDEDLVYSDQSEGLALRNREIIQTKTIILIAQYEENANLLCQLIPSAGYQIVWLINIETVIEQIPVLNPSLLIIDQSFSTDEIKQLKDNLPEINRDNSLKLILLHSQLNEQEQEDFSAQGIDDYLSLSMTPNELLEKIDAFMLNAN